MATVREYGYYMQGTKISLIEKEAAFDNDPNSKDYGPGTDRFEWKSPLDSITDGLEILYSYAPTYNIALEGPSLLNQNSAGSGTFSVFGWTVRGGYLTFVLGGLDGTAYKDFSHTDYDEELGTAGEQYIVISGSNRWDGSHQIKTRGVGFIETNTKVYGYGYIEQAASFDFDDSTFQIDTDDFAGALNETFKEYAGGLSFYIMFTDYTHSVAANNQRIYKASFTSGSPDIITASKYMSYYFPDSGWTEGNLTDSHMDDVTNNIYRMNTVYRDECILFGKDASQTLQDESFTIDLPEYLCKALIPYVKSKYLENAGQYEESEYLMAKFRKQVEKYNNSLIGGPRIIAPGPYSIK